MSQTQQRPSYPKKARPSPQAIANRLAIKRRKEATRSR